MLADYYRRTAVAAAQVLSGFDEEWFRTRLGANPVGISVGATPSREGLALADLLVRLTARLYPSLTVTGDGATKARLSKLAQAINPKIEIALDAPVGIAVGDGKPFESTIFAGADGWDALISASVPQPTGDTDNPFGPGVAACLAAAGLFRSVFMGDFEERVDGQVRFSTLISDRVDVASEALSPPWRLEQDALLVGAGAVGQGALWALSRAPLNGTLHVIDMETIELSNLQRYVLTERVDEDREKVEIAAELPSTLSLMPHPEDLGAFVAENGYHWDAVLLALDSARDRVSAQAMLPRFVVNAWTQPGDLGVSAHSRFGGPGACVACLYLPDEQRKNEDQLISETLGVPQLLMQVRTLLATEQPVDRNFLEVIAQTIGQPLDALLPFEGRTVRELYVEGFCGGAVIPIGQAGQLNQGAQGVHVPLAHQSALAGILLAAALVLHAIAGDPEVTQVTRLDVLKAVPQNVRQPMRARRDGRCICDDPDFVSAYAAKYG